MFTKSTKITPTEPMKTAAAPKPAAEPKVHGLKGSKTAINNLGAFAHPSKKKGKKR